MTPNLDITFNVSGADAVSFFFKGTQSHHLHTLVTSLPQVAYASYSPKLSERLLKI